MVHELFERIDAESGCAARVQRRARLMGELDGLDDEAIAATLEQPVNTVKSYIFRARDDCQSRAPAACADAQPTLVEKTP